MLDPLWTHLSGRVNGFMIAFNELAQTNAQISERDQVPWTAGRNKRTLRYTTSLRSFSTNNAWVDWSGTMGIIWRNFDSELYN